MSTLDNVIDKINGYIKQIIQDMITIRTKYVEASEKIIDKMRYLLDQKSYNYVAKRLYDWVVAIETPSAIMSQAYAPEMKLQYSGAKMTLQYDSEYIEVPSVPVFVFEPQPIAQRIDEITSVAVSNAVLVRVKKAEGLEPPDYENAYNYFYRLNYDFPISPDGYATYDLPAKFISLWGVVYQLSKFIVYSGAHLSRWIIKDQKKASARIDIGKVIVTKDTYDVEIDAVRMYLTTDYDGELGFIVYGIDVGKGTYLEDVGAWVREVLCIFATEKPIILVLL